MSWLLYVGTGLAMLIGTAVIKIVMAKPKTPESEKKKKYGVVIPSFGNEHMAFSLHFEGIGGKPAGPVGDESLALLQDFAPFTNCCRVEDSRNILVDNDKLNVYGMFEDDKGVVLVEPAPEAACKGLKHAATFQYQQLRGTAHKRAILISLRSFHAAVTALKAQHNITSKATEEALLSRIVFVHSTGRCGSTLLSKALGSAYDICSISEPDIYSTVFLAQRDKRLARSEAQQLLRDATFLLALRSGINDKGSKHSHLAIKFRSWVALDFDTVHKAVPEAKVLCQKETER